ncbi:DUF3857 domain-containing protein [Lutibacter sp. A80]|uniref:DUF3857 domain-containing protein n=1 Tax=Lutibacter sp. A80 TaxID=2918453 RepID=UPI001F05D1BB|nr:DUF3857 domain-containing protein [Lutibacter sp. A80]UMB60128.1 DUF3857 domain-containing protein [Lutibacter sp. A80]
MKKLRSAPFYFLLFFTLFSFSQDLNFNISKIPDSLKKDANSVIRFENFSLDIQSQRQMIYSVDAAITIYNKLADEFADITIYYNKGTNIKNVKAYVYNASGKEIKKIKKSDFKDFSASGGALYSDNRALYYNYTPIGYPYTIHYTYEVKTSNTAFIPPWFPVDSYRQSVQKSSYTIKCPSDIVLRKSENNFMDYQIKKTEGSEILKYFIQNVPAEDSEPYSPSIRELVPNVKFGVNKFNLEGVDGEANNWSEFGKWYYNNLLKSTFDLPESTKKEIQNLTSVTENPIEKAKIVYNYVQDKVRYISIQVGIGGFKPMLASEVDKLSYGDCKALTNYTKTLLDAAGVASNYTLIYGDRTKRDIDNEFLSHQGNHAVLNIPTNTGDLWLECTSQKTPFAEGGDFTDDRNALVISPEGGEIKRTKIYDDKENHQKIIGKYILNNNGAIKAIVNMVCSGIQFDNHIYYEGATSKELDELYKEFWSNINNITIDSIAIKNNKEEGRFEESIRFSAINYGLISGERMIVPINAFNVFEGVPKRIRNRKLPIVLSRGFYDVDEVEVELPDDYKIEAIAESVEIDSEFGMYKLTIEKVSDKILKYKREILIKSGNYPKDFYDNFRDFLKKIAKNDKSKIVLLKK